MSDPILPLAVWQEGTLQNDVPANDNALRVEALSREVLGTEDSPTSSNDGDVFIVGGSPSGDFSTFDPDDLTIYRGGNWYAWAPVDGIVVNVSGTLNQYAGSSGWAPIGGSSSVNWGDIGGMLSMQTDLQEALDDKADTSSLAAIATSGALLDATDFPGGTTDFLRADGSFATPSGGSGGSPGGADTNVQYNDGGSFGGDAAFTFNDTTKALGIPILNTAKGTDIARAGTTDIWSATGNFVHLTGTTTITSFGANTAGQFRIVRFAGAGTLTHNATSLILPGAANITTAANDTAIVVGEGSSNARVVVYNRASGLPIVNPSVSITGWTPSTNTSSPNNTVNAARMLVASASTDADGVIQAKGAGALMAQLPDATSIGGNKRGPYATDWQKSRAGGAQVASGQYATISGGANNAASAQSATVAGGESGDASNAYATVSGGYGGIASGNAAAVGGGTDNAATATNSCVPGGANNDADGEYSIAIGFKGQARGMQGALAHSIGGFNNFDGDGQDRKAYLCQQTTDATQATATTNRAAADTINQFILPDNSAFAVKGTVVVRENATGDTAAWDFTALIKRGSGAGTTAMVVACTPVSIGADPGASTWTISVDADTTNGGLRCRVTGQAAHNLKWGWSIYSCNEVVG